MNALPEFSFIWPRLLWLLCLAPVLAGLYAWHARRNRQAMRFPALQAAGLVVQGGSRWRRHVPPLLALLAVAALLVATARPQAMLRLPSKVQTVILAMDMSGSMRAEDVKPSRMQAARQAAKAFVAEQPAGVRVGVVAVAGTAAVAHPPSRRKDEVSAAIDRLQPQRGSALGNGLAIALSTLLPRGTVDTSEFLNPQAGPPNRSPREPAAGASAGAARPGQGADYEGPPPSRQEAAPGSYEPGAIVLMSDGESNAGRDVLQAAELAARHGVRIYTVGIGTAEGAVLSVEGWSARVRLDDAVLKKVADVTGASYFRVDDAKGLKQVYRSLSARLAYDRTNMVEITAVFTALGALLAACAAMLSLWWFGRVV
ncbi:RNA polymerase II transcription initiation/nucleotide excision repair factor TFIIH%2C subunit SSL1 [Bordetella ansorpii]|uniref:RNA polymerase II transcription initiation/nucleotide excision repair factor TFIIH, subunit SSL1 n=1 Tax=Bordetella ansorpii TaxID=288768 RepID=A0A157SWG0_9BORD|nr:VWA domain-containing protein [Bordetella ansorpii]SAI74777.1 RNA polymerase II transcription initiation/nucleotide excision repair factor TFIIH%2C subunit SSL1 [Bordetella ansorpii]